MKKESIKDVILSTLQTFGILVIISMGVILIVQEVVNNHRLSDQISQFNQPDIIE